MDTLFAAILIFATLSFAVVGWQMSRSQKQIQERVATLESTSSSQAAVMPSQRGGKLNDSFAQRVIFPLAQQISDKIQALIPTSGKSWIRKKAIQAGYTKPQFVKVFIGIHCMTTILPVAFFLFLILVKGSVSGMLAIVLVVFSGLIGFVFPLLWLFQQAGKRSDSIRKALPDFIDLLVICVEAGLGLDMAIAKIANLEGMQSSIYLKEELIRYTKDVGFGKPRKEALLSLAERSGLDDLTAIVGAIIQSYEMGTGVTQTLRVQSEGLRQKRMHRAEEKANKISVKMVLPIYFFFFPSIFIVILGPLLLHVAEQVAKTMGHVKF